MPFWKKEKASGIPDHYAFVESHFNKVQDDFATTFESEAKALTQLGLPVPTQHGVVSKAQDRFNLPSFTIPSHCCYPFREMSNGITITYTLVCDEQTLAKAQNDFGKVGFHGIVKNYPGVWSTRDPYTLHKHINEKKYKGYAFGHYWPLFEHFSPAKLEAVSPPAELELCCRRYSFVRGLIEQCVPYELPESPRIFATAPIPQSFPDNLLHNLPLPNKDLSEGLTTIKILPNPDTNPRVMRQFFDSLRSLTCPAFFELETSGNTIYFQFSFAPQDQSLIESQLKLYFPDFAILPASPVPELASLHTFEVAPFVRYAPIKTSNDFPIDPYQQLFALLSYAKPEDYVSIQCSFVPIRDTAIQMVNSYLEGYRRSEALVVERVRSLENKLPAWFFGLRVFSTRPGVLEAVKNNFLKQYDGPNQRWSGSKTTQVAAKDQRAGVWGLVNTDELTALVHFPNKTINCDLLETASMKAKLPPDLYTQTGVVIGESAARGQTKIVTIPDSVRDRHAYIVGKSGTGKSTLLFNAIRQDIERGSGVAVIDPHGDLAEEVLQYIPESRIEDTIYFNAGDKAHPIGLNILNAQDEDEIGLLADDLLITFKRLSESWGERMENILRYSFHTLLRCEDATFLDLKILLQNPDFRLQVAAHTNNRMLRDFWHLEYPNYPKDAGQPILNRMSKFSLSPTLTGILGQPDSSLNFFDVIQNKKILLVNISKGQIGEDTAQLLGSLIVSQLQLAIMRRASLPKESRDPYYLYVDEFQNFTTSAFEKILSEARKYKLCLTLAHQYISQLDEKTKNAILANVGTIVMFQSYPADAQALRPELGQYEPTDVTNLNTSNHEALCKPSTQSKDTFLFQTLAPSQRPQSYAREIIEYTRENYATTPIQYDTPREVHSPAPPPDLPAPTKLPRPAHALAKEFANQGDRILHYVQVAEWLATAQIHELCYSHIAEASRAPNASRDLKALVEAKRIKFQNFGKSKIYYTGRQVNPTTHNLAIRDLFSKIVASGYEIAEVNFFPQLPGLTPDLAISFLNDDGSQTKTFWEYDAGTEGIAELLKKVSRYEILGTDSLVVFVFNTKERLHQFAKAAGAARIVVAVISEFTTLDDGVFVFLQTAGGGGTASEASGLFV